MTTEMSVYVCDNAAKAVQAQQFLVNGGYAAADITTEQVQNFNYDASTYDGGTSDNLSGKFVVIGRK